MKVIKTASGKNRIKMSKSEWTSIGKKAGWIKSANESERTPEEVANVMIQRNNSGYGIPIWEVISQFEDILYGNDREGIRKYYPGWSDEDFKECIELLRPHEDDVARERDLNLWV